MIEPEALASLLAFASPAFPTGGFAYSHGLEWAVACGAVADQASLRTWVGTALSAGAGWSDAILLRHAYRAGSAEARAELSTLAAAMSPSAERQLETTAQGAAFAHAMQAWGMSDAAEHAYPVAFGAAAAAQGIGEDPACLGYLSVFAASMVSAAIRLVPLGQSDGVRTIAALQSVLLDTLARTRGATLADLGGACFFADLCSLHHETQYSRMFRS